MGKIWAAIAFIAIATVSGAQTVETDPIDCWWRTSASAVKVGDPFTLVLTCAVVDTDAVRVVPDQSPLEPNVAQFPPFETLGGTHPADLRSGDRRFFQYEYRLRVIADDLFGRDVKLPELKITYRVQSQVAKATTAAIEGREQTYLLPSMTVRVLSLVPPDATEIRDATTETFADVDALRVRASLLITIAGVLFALAGLAAVIVIVRVISRRLARSTTTRQPLSDTAILRGVGRELRAIQRERGAGWTPELVSRLTTATRIVSAYALSNRVGQTSLAPGAGAQDGQLVVRGGWTLGTRVLVSGTVTAGALSQVIARTSDAARGAHRAALIGELEPALGQLTLSRYSTETVLDDRALDQSLDLARRAVRRLSIEHTWIYRKISALTRAGMDMGQRVWSR
jgi:hypothetical protein